MVQNINFTTPLNEAYQPFKTQQLVIPANGTFVAQIPFQMIRCISTTDDSAIEVQISTSTGFVPFAGGLAYRITAPQMENGDYYERAIFRNNTASDVTIVAGFAFGEILDDRVAFSGTINVSIVGASNFDSQADVTVLTTATTLILAANSARKGAIISNPQANGTVIRVGDSGAGASNGIEVPVGGTFSTDSTGAIYVYNPSAGSIVIGRLET